jgi:hypothetical protein
MLPEEGQVSLGPLTIFFPDVSFDTIFSSALWPASTRAAAPRNRGGPLFFLVDRSFTDPSASPSPAWTGDLNPRS